MANNKNSATLKRLRREQAFGGQLQGYNGPGGVSQAVQGDDEGPFLKVPPFPGKVQIIARIPEVQTSAYGMSAIVECAGKRTLTLWVLYDPAEGEDDSVLSIIPLVFEQSEEGPGQGYPIAVISPTITPMASPLEAYGSRTVYQTELRTPELDAAALFTLQFDCSAYGRMAFLVREVGDQVDPGGALQLGVSLSE